MARTGQGWSINAAHPALVTGVVLGQYPRCDVSAPFRGDRHASRVHCMLVRKRGVLWVFDAASTNGTRILDRAGSGMRGIQRSSGARVEAGESIIMGATSFGVEGACK